MRARVLLPVALLLLGGCRVGDLTFTPGINLGHNPQTGDNFYSVGFTTTLPLRHDPDQWQQAFGRRTRDIEEIARMREETASAKRGEEAALARADAAEKREKHLEGDLAKADAPWYEWIVNKFSEIEWTWPAAIVAVVGIGAFVLVRRRRRRRSNGK